MMHVENRLVYQLNATYNWAGVAHQLVAFTKGAVVMQRRSDAKRRVLHQVTFAALIAKGEIVPAGVAG